MAVDRSKFTSTSDQGAAPEADEEALAAPQSASRVEALFREHNEALVSFLRGRLPNETDAREAAQEAYVRLLQLEEPAQPSFLRAYLFKVAANVATDLRRRRETRLRYDEADDDLSIAAQERSIIAREQLVTIERALAELPSKCSEAFRLSRDEGRSSSEIAEKLGVTPRMVRIYLIRTLEHLQARLETKR